MFITKDSIYWTPFTEMPQGWHKYNGNGILSFYNPLKKLYVISTKEMLDDNNGLLKPCHHVSVSRKGKPIKWNDIVYVKELFMGEEVEAFHIIPKRSEYVNIHQNCFHIWSWV